MNNSYFKYKDKYYSPGTIIKFKDSFVKTRTTNPTAPVDKRIWPYGRFKLFNTQCGMYYFDPCKFELGVCILNCSYFFISPSELENAIEEIIEPNQVILIPVVRKKDWEIPELMVGWLIYITIMIASTIFKGCGGLWFFESYIFFCIRYQILNKN